METLIQLSNEKYAKIQLRTIRNFINEVDWNNRMIGIKGGRGIGKTTLLLQYYKKNFKPDGSVLYISLDHFFFAENKLYDLAGIFYRKGGKLLLADEIHRYPDWSVELKNIYDDFQDLKVVFTGSSLIHMRKAKADLSRRAVMYEMPGLSFREFLNFETNRSFPVFPIEKIISGSNELIIPIIEEIRPLEHFHKYLRHGYYPFYLENIPSFRQKLYESIQLVAEVDIPQFEQIQTSHILSLKKLLQVIATSAPFKPNMNSISERTGISINTLKKYLLYLADAQVILFLHSPAKGINSLNKPEKVYLHNTNIMYALSGDQSNVGSLRETFFLNQLNQVAEISASPYSDFLVNNTYTFEVGGHSKSRKQIKGKEDAFVVRDDIETGYDHIIPLWMFGFLY
jgi:hypothetical protein